MSSSGGRIAELADVGGRGPLLRLTVEEIGATVMLGALRGDAGLAIVGREQTVASLATGPIAGNGLSISAEGGGDNSVSIGFLDGVRPIVFLRDGERRVGTVLSMDGVSTRDLRDEAQPGSEAKP